MTAWLMQMGDFVQIHALRANRIRVAAPTPVNGFENAQLIAVEGWREESKTDGALRRTDLGPLDIVSAEDRHSGGTK
jgi:hypothetical protein